MREKQATVAKHAIGDARSRELRHLTEILVEVQPRKILFTNDSNTATYTHTLHNHGHVDVELEILTNRPELLCVDSLPIKTLKAGSKLVMSIHKHPKSPENAKVIIELKPSESAYSHALSGYRIYIYYRVRELAFDLLEAEMREKLEISPEIEQLLVQTGLRTEGTKLSKGWITSSEFAILCSALAHSVEFDEALNEQRRDRKPRSNQDKNYFKKNF